MNRDEIIRMARDAGFESHDIKLNFPKELERFANLVAAAEREACVEEIRYYLAHSLTAKDILDAIRPREKE